MDTQFFKGELLKEKEKVLNSIHATPETEDFSGDEIDKAVKISEASLAQKFNNRNRQYLVKIEKALAKIEKGEFGLCEVCEEDIGEKRLKIHPTSDLCIACKEHEEWMKKMYKVSQ